MAQGVFSQSADYAIYVLIYRDFINWTSVFSCIVTVSFEYVERKCPELFLVAHLWLLSLCCGFTRFPNWVEFSFVIETGRQKPILDRVLAFW